MTSRKLDWFAFAVLSLAGKGIERLLEILLKLCDLPQIWRVFFLLVFEA